MHNYSFIPFGRSLFSNALWKERRKYSRAEAWIDLIQTASFCDEDRIIQNKGIKLRRGQLAASERFLMDRWDWSKSKVCRFLKWLVKESMIERYSDQSVSIITLCNYEKYNPLRTSKDPATIQQKPNEEPNIINIIKKRKERIENSFLYINDSNSLQESESTVDKENWILDISQNPLYAHLNVQNEFERMRKWYCDRNLQPTRENFVKWLSNTRANSQKGKSVTMPKKTSKFATF